MTIEFINVVPEPLFGLLHTSSNHSPKSEIWQNEMRFEASKKYQIDAPSGKGKSTFIHIIYGLRTDFSGEVNIYGKSVKQIKAGDWAKIRQEKMAVIFQDLRLFLNLTALENIQVKAILSPKDTQRTILEMADYLGVEPLLNKKAALLSYGERQRIAIIRALVQPFEFLLMDEPFSHLDEGNIEKACKLIEEKVLANKAALLMTSLGYTYSLQFDKKLLL